MSRKRRKHKYSRRTPISAGRRRVLPIVLIAVLAVCAVVAIAVGLGAYLRRKAEDYSPSEREDDDIITPVTGKGEAVIAPLYSYDASVYSVMSKGYKALSMSLGTARNVSFKSEIAGMLSDISVGDIELSAYTSSVKYYGGRACGYFISDAFECEDENTRRLKKAYETALMCEAASMGIDDILILGINVTERNIDEVCEYMRQLHDALGECSVGICVSAGVMELTGQGVYIATELKESCDFLALDMRELEFTSLDGEGTDVPSSLEEYLGSLKYYIKSYSMRLLFSDGNIDFFDTACKLGYSNVQAVYGEKRE